MKYITVILAFTAAAFISSAAAAQCTGQGAGNCNIVYSCDSEIDSDNIDCDMTLYSHTCAVIGGVWEAPNQGQALYSQLPYAIIVVDVQSIYTTEIEVTFRYAGGYYGTDITNCSKHSCSSGINACEYAVCSFPCPA